MYCCHFACATEKRAFLLRYCSLRQIKNERMKEFFFLNSPSLVSLGLIKEERKEYRNGNVQCFASVKATG